MKWEENEIIEIIEKLKSGVLISTLVSEYRRTEKSIREKIKKIGLKYSDLIPSSDSYENVKCHQCEKEFSSLINTKRKFCSSSCSATYNNKGVVRHGVKKEKNDKISRTIRDKGSCLICNERLKTYGSKCCSYQCNAEYQKKKRWELIEGGDITLHQRQYKKYLIEKHGEKCMECGWCEVHPITKKVPIELEHIDGNSSNNSLDNLKLLCPNCHSLTLTYKALNVGNGRSKRMERYRDGKSF